MSKPSSLAKKSIKNLGLTNEVEETLASIHEEVERAYRERFIELTGVIREQSAALQRISATLDILVQHVAPQLASTAPVAFKIAGESEHADVATIKVFSDPIAAGFVLTQTDLAKSLGITTTDTSILVRAFGLVDNPELAVTVRRGKTQATVNYHRSAVEVFHKRVQRPPSGLKSDAQSALRRVRKKLKLGE